VGCLETLLSDRVLVAEARQEVDPQIKDIDGLISSVNAGNQKTVEILTRAGKLLGMQIANLVNLFDPKLIIISGEGIRMGDVFFSAVRSSFAEGVMPGLAQDTEIRVNSWGDDIWALGAASLVIAEIFISPIQKEDRTILGR
jgi:predicted NBD/HSP70 family sugar kinase